MNQIHQFIQIDETFNGYMPYKPLLIWSWLYNLNLKLIIDVFI